MRTFQVRISQSDLKSRDHSAPSMETVKIMLLYCKLKIWKLGLSIYFCFTASTSGKQARLCHEWNVVCLFWHKFAWNWLWLAEKIHQWSRCVVTSVIPSRIHGKALSLIIFKQNNMVSCPQKENSKRCSTLCPEGIRNSFLTSLSMYGYGHNFVMNNTCRDKKHLKYYLEVIFTSPQNY